MSLEGEPATTDLRGSSAIDLAYELQANCIDVHIYDYLVPHSDLSHLPFVSSSLEDSCAKCEVVIIMNNNPDNVSDSLLHILNSKPTLLLMVGHNMMFFKYLTQNICYSTMGYIDGR